MFLLRQENRRTCFIIKTREHENKREGEDLLEQNENMRLGWALPNTRCLRYPHLNHWIFHSSLFTLHLNYWIFHSSLFTLHLNHWILHSSFFTLHLNHWIFHFSLFTFLFHYGSPSHLTIISTSLVDSHLTFFLYPCSTSAWCSSGQRLTHIISRFTATCGSVEGK